MLARSGRPSSFNFCCLRIAAMPVGANKTESDRCPEAPVEHPPQRPRPAGTHPQAAGRTRPGPARNPDPSRSRGWDPVDRGGTKRNETERNGKFRKVPERDGTFRNGSETRKSFGDRGLSISCCEFGFAGTGYAGQATRTKRGNGFLSGTLRTQHSALRTGLFGCQALRERTLEARPLHPYRARKPLRAQTCCHNDPACHKSRPGRRPKFSFSRDFDGRGGSVCAQTCHGKG